MNLADHLRRAQDDLINTGRTVTNLDVFEHAMTDPEAVVAFDAEAMGKARQHALRTISSNLSASIGPTTDPDLIGLFNASDYRPPMCVSIPGDNGTMRHKGVLYATDEDLDAHEGVLSANIDAVRVKYFTFAKWRKSIGALDGGTVRSALARARREAA